MTTVWSIFLPHDVGKTATPLQYPRQMFLTFSDVLSVSSTPMSSLSIYTILILPRTTFTLHLRHPSLGRAVSPPKTQAHSHVGARFFLSPQYVTSLLPAKAWPSRPTFTLEPGLRVSQGRTTQQRPGEQLFSQDIYQTHDLPHPPQTVQRHSLHQKAPPSLPNSGQGDLLLFFNDYPGGTQENW